MEKLGKIIEKLKWWTTSLLVMIFNVIQDEPGFASMGSTGGGGGGGSSSGGSSSGGSGNLGFDLIMTSGFFVGGFLGSILSIIYHWIIPVDHNNLDVQDLRNYSDLLTPNLTLETFNQLVDQYGLNLEYKGSSVVACGQSLVELYAKAQFNYGDGIRRLISGQYTTFDAELKPLLGKIFYKTMRKEMYMKATAGSLDDVVVSSGHVNEAYKLSDNMLLAKIDVTGFDREVSLDHDFDSTFERQKWSDWVLFGRKDNSSSWKILNLIYGEHFHLKGHDFNHQKGLSDAGYSEHDYSTEPMKEAYHRNKLGLYLRYMKSIWVIWAITMMSVLLMVLVVEIAYKLGWSDKTDNIVSSFVVGLISLFVSWHEAVEKTDKNNKNGES